MTPALNPALDRQALAAAFAREGRLHIPGVLTADSAARVHQCLAQETDYSLLCQTGPDQAVAYRAAGLARQKEIELMNAAYARAQGGFEYLYDAHSVSRDGDAYPDPAHYWAVFNRFLNSAPFLDFARALTGRPEIAFADAQATRYRPGHFLSQHDDANVPGRVAAYVFNFTPFWRADWGGALLFSDGPGHVSGGYLPAFNALNLLAVPQEHLVGFVSPFAGAHRFSITGWLRAA
jgi:Rps23 Pro-64 3,4-dihydroxylase Tpa1-like proline 4-hydroxylase